MPACRLIPFCQRKNFSCHTDENFANAENFLHRTVNIFANAKTILSCTDENFAIAENFSHRTDEKFFEGQEISEKFPRQGQMREQSTGKLKQQKITTFLPATEEVKHNGQDDQSCSGDSRRHEALSEKRSNDEDAKQHDRLPEHDQVQRVHKEKKKKRKSRKKTRKHS